MKLSRSGNLLTDDQWCTLLHKLTLHATSHVNRWYWRRSAGGILPDGFDPQSLASEAIADFLQVHRAGSLTLPQLQRDLERRVRRIVNRLHHRAENRLFRNEPDLAPVLIDDGELTSRINLIPEPASNPAEVLLEKESARQFTKNALRFSASLGRDPNLHRLFHCYCGGHSKPRHLATALKMRPATIKNLRRRFLRKWRRFHQSSRGFRAH